MRKLTNLEAPLDNDVAEISVPSGVIRFIELSDGVLSRPKIRLAVEHEDDDPTRIHRMSLVDIEADHDDNYVFVSTMPRGVVREAHIHGGMRRNHLVMIVDADDADDTDEIKRTFLFVAEDAELPDSAEFVCATRPVNTDGAWAIYEIAPQ